MAEATNSLRSDLQKLYNAALGVLPYRTRMKVDYLRRSRFSPNLDEPRLHSERLLSRMFETDRPELVRACSKAAMKKYASEIIEREGFRIKIPRTLMYFREGDLPLTARDLPESTEPWVMKPNHLGGGIVLFSDELGRTDERSLTAFLKKTHSIENAYSRTAPLAWRAAERGILVEERIGSSSAALVDYKMHVFNGEVQLISVYSGRRDVLSVSHFDLDGTLLFTRGPLPPKFDSLIEFLPAAVPAAMALNLGLEYARVDFYFVNGQLFFGEISPFGALEGVQSYPDFDRALGDLWIAQEKPTA